MGLRIQDFKCPFHRFRGAQWGPQVRAVACDCRVCGVGDYGNEGRDRPSFPVPPQPHSQPHGDREALGLPCAPHAHTLVTPLDTPTLHDGVRTLGLRITSSAWHLLPHFLCPELVIAAWGPQTPNLPLSL